MTQRNSVRLMLIVLVMVPLLLLPNTFAYWTSLKQPIVSAASTGAFNATVTIDPTQNAANGVLTAPLRFVDLYPGESRRLATTVQATGNGTTLKWRYKVDVAFPATVTAIDASLQHIEAFVERPDCATPTNTVTSAVTGSPSALTTGWIDCKYAPGDSVTILLGVHLKTSAPTAYIQKVLTPTYTVTVAQSVTP